MPIVLFIAGVVFLVAAVRGTHTLLFDTLKDDFTGPNNFLYWGIALFVIGAVGYYKPLKPVSNAFMLLVVIVLFFSNRGFFNKFMEQIGASTGTQLKNAVVGSWDVSNPSQAFNQVLGDLSKISGSFWKGK